MSGFGQVTCQHFVCLLSAFCRFQNLETPFIETYFASTNFYRDYNHSNAKNNITHSDHFGGAPPDRFGVHFFQPPHPGDRNKKSGSAFGKHIHKPLNQH